MLKDLIEKRARLHEQASAILKKAHEEKRERLSAEEQQAFDRLHEEIDAYKAHIDRVQRSDQVEQELSASLGRRSDPVQPGREDGSGGNGHGEPAARRIIQQSEEDRLEAIRVWFMAGSELRSKITPHQFEIANRIGLDPNARQISLYLSRRAPRSVADVDDPRWQARSLSVGVTTAGGFTVPDEMMRPLEVALLSFGGMRQAATVIRTDSGAALPWPTSNDTAQEGAILAENVAASQQDVVFGQLVLDAFKYSSKMILVSVELLQDNAVNIAQFLGTALGTRIGRITNRHFTVGTGTAQPNGAVTAAVVGKTAVAGQLTTVTYADLVDLEHSVDPEYRTGARWMCHDSSLKAIKKIVDTTGRPLWQPGLAGIAPGFPDTILGYPYIVNNHMAVMAASARSIAFGQLSKYIIRDVTEINLLRLDERFAEFHQVAFLAYSRHDGDLLDAGTNPVKVLAHPAA